MEKIKHYAKSIDNKITTKVLIIVFVLAIALRLLLTQGLQLYFITDTTYDDLMQILKVFSLLEGEWLGTYGPLTLVKGVGYPLFAAIFSFFNIPYILAYHCLYVIASLSFMYAIYPMIKSNLLRIFIFLFVLFNPIAFSIHVNRFYRDSIYYSLVLLCVSLLLCFITRYENKVFAFFSGIGFAFVVLTREDFHYILIYVIACSISNFVITYVKEKSLKNSIIKLVLLIAGYFVIIAPLSLINHSYYGTYDLDEYQSSSFATAYGALSRLDAGLRDSTTTISYEERMKLYEHSDAFMELYPLLDAEDAHFSAWKEIHGDYRTGFFSFALRDAVALLGYYESPQAADEYYNRLTDEINEYCNTLDYEPGPKRSGVHARFYIEDTPNIISSFLSGATHISSFEGISCLPIPAEADDEYLKVFENIANSSIAANRYMESGEIVANYSLSGLSLWMQRAMRVIIILYQVFFKFLVLLAAILWVHDTVKVLLKKCEVQKTIQWLAVSSLLGLLVARITMLAFVDATTFSAVLNPSYQSASYVIMVSLTVLQIAKTLSEWLSSNK